VDNGHPWGKAGGQPSALALWVVGLGIGIHINDPHCPQQNGVLESTNGVSQRWVNPGSCGNFAEFSRRVEEEDRNQRERYPAVEGKSRWQAYVGLRHSGRGYCRGWEEMVWELEAALAFLGQFTVRRKVSMVGQVSVYHRLIRAVPKGSASGYAGRVVEVGFDPCSREWVIREVGGAELNRVLTDQFSRKAIMAVKL